MSGPGRDDAAQPPPAEGKDPAAATPAKKPEVGAVDSIASAVKQATGGGTSSPDIKPPPKPMSGDIDPPTLPGVGPGAPPPALVPVAEDPFAAPALAAKQAEPGAAAKPGDASAATKAVDPDPDGEAPTTPNKSETATGPEPTTAPRQAGRLSSEPPTMPLVAVANTPSTLGAEPDGIRVHLFGQTDVGLVREHNEDNFLIGDLARSHRGVDESTITHTIEPRGSVFAVCDGMGGAAAGEVASQMAVDTVYERMQAGGPPRDRDDFARRLVRAIEEAGSRIFTSAKLDRTRRGMGTTSTVAGLIDKVLFVGQVGDSRAYVLRGESFAQVTKDQSLVNQLIEAGQLSEEEAEAFEHSNIILQALGTAEVVHVDLTFLELRHGDRLLLCSDGLSGLVHADLMKEVLTTITEPAACCARLIEMARNGGGHDNITVVVVDFDGKGLPAPAGTDSPSYMQYPLPPGEVDPRESLPPRETSIKATSTKPGADVKGDGVPTTRPGASDDAPVIAPPASRQWMIVVFLLVAIVAAVIVLAMAQGGPSQQGGTGGEQVPGDGTERVIVAPNTPITSTTPPPAPGEVRIHTDVAGGELFVDGESRGAVPPTGEMKFVLAPGAYRIEVRSGGSAVASQLVNVEAGAARDVTLTVPSGTTNVIAPTGEPVVREFGGVSTPVVRQPGATGTVPAPGGTATPTPGGTPTPTPTPGGTPTPTPPGTRTPTPTPTGGAGTPTTTGRPGAVIPDNPF